MASGWRHGIDFGSSADAVLEAMLAKFPFRIRGFCSDYGRESSIKTVTKTLNKLLVERTKSRPRHSNDNCRGRHVHRTRSILQGRGGWGDLHAARGVNIKQEPVVLRIELSNHTAAFCKTRRSGGVGILQRKSLVQTIHSAPPKPPMASRTPTMARSRYLPAPNLCGRPKRPPGTSRCSWRLHSWSGTSSARSGSDYSRFEIR